jgi:hypothetical protein
MGQFSFKTTFGDEHNLEISASQILLSSYLVGSISGGTGTEKFSKVAGDDLIGLLKEMNFASTNQLVEFLSHASQEKLDTFADLVRNHEFVTVRWAETDWSE